MKWYHRDPMRSLYVRFSDKFERIGWVFERCGHMELDREKYRRRREEIEQVKNEKYDKMWKERMDGEDNGDRIQ
jgi:hypothetical protein